MSSSANPRPAWLLPVAAFGAIVPNGLFLRWLVTEFSTLRAVLADHLAVAFILDAALATGLLCWFFAVNPRGRHGWPVFLLLSLLGGLGFSIPLFLWMNGGAGEAAEARAGSS
jgi:hypothetical protein